MPQAALAVDWEAVKAHAIIHGPRNAARSFGINENTVLYRSAREGWLKQAGQVQVIQPLPTSMQPIQPIRPITASEAALSAKAKLGEKTWIKQSKAVLKGSTAAAKLPGQAILSHAQQLKSLVDSADKLHGWSKQDQASTLININCTGPAHIQSMAMPRPLDVQDI